MQRERPLIVLILDGWGIGKENAQNAIFQAHTPTMDHFFKEYPWAPIGAAGEHIGLSKGHQGSTEMGHLIISAGRNVLLPQMQVADAISSGSIQKQKLLRKLFASKKEFPKKRIHIMGLLSDAGVHSYDALCHTLLEMAAAASYKGDDILIHIFSDGRDTPPTSLPKYVERLQQVIDATGVGVIASLQGRFFPMDRDHRFERIEKAYRLLVEGKGLRTATTIDDAILQARAAGETDEFITPTAIGNFSGISDGDTVINFNYRVDREIEITQALIEPEFDHFVREKKVAIEYIPVFPYYEGMPATALFQRTELSLKNILPEVLSKEGLTQYRITETEKWVYVTKIFNAMSERIFDGEIRRLIPSDKIDRFDDRPQMQAMPIVKDIVSQMDKKTADIYIANICNADMLGHTGNLEATIRGCEAIDDALAVLYEAVQRHDTTLLITADHGDAEVMWDHDQGLPHTQHTDNVVPCILVDSRYKGKQLRIDGALRDIAPTILDILGIEKPQEMNGKSLLLS